MKNCGLCASASSVEREAAAAGNVCKKKIMTAYMLSMKTPALTYCDRQLPRPDSLQPQSMGTMQRKIQGSLKRIANEKQSGSEKARKPCGVSLKLIRGELKEREGMENGRRVWGFV